MNSERQKKSQRSYMARRYESNREALRRHKLNSGCADCGYNGHHATLEFDHVDGVDDPRNRVSQLVNHTWARIQREIDRCEVVCANCHRIRTFDRLQVKLATQRLQ